MYALCILAHTAFFLCLRSPPLRTQANLPAQFDVAVLIDRTSALQALDAPEDSVPRPGTPDLMESEEEEEGLEG